MSMCHDDVIFLQELADEIRPFGRVVALEANSANLISVIQEAFNVSIR